MSSQERAAASMNPPGWLPGITDAALAHPKEYARGSIGTTEREGYPALRNSFATLFSTRLSDIGRDMLVGMSVAEFGTAAQTSGYAWANEGRGG